LRFQDLTPTPLLEERGYYKLRRGAIINFSNVVNRTLTLLLLKEKELEDEVR
jgi:hypothetical protein